MSNYSDQLEQIKTLIKSPLNQDKSHAYSTLQHLQQQASNDDSLIQSLVDSSEVIVSSIIADIRVDDADEEIVALALKCLGFMVYQPSLVAAITKNLVDRVLETLTRLIITTKIKAVCNLGVWCISIQQLDASSLSSHFDSLLRAIVHSLDNPVGSLSTTFEAIQAVMKLATQLSEKMRDTSSIWAPPLYRRLLSADKRERETCLRCLLKINRLIIAPQPALSKAIAHDLKLRLLPEMKEMLKIGKKIQALQAWGWFIRILGYYSLKNRHFVNELLQVPEQTFSDPDPQVQIATLVAWEGLIDALLCLPPKVCDTVTIHQHKVEQDEVKSIYTSQVNGGITKTGYSKSLKLVMTPVIGIISSKADGSVQLYCLNTWCYLLHKLDTVVNDPHILGIVVEPLLKVVFSIGLDDRNIRIWSFCINLLQDFIQSKTSGVNYASQDQVNHKLSPCVSPAAGECNYSVKWLPWDFSQLDFLIRILQMIFSQAAAAKLCSENRRLVCHAISRIFRIFLKGVQIDLAKNSTSYDTVMQSISAILVFSKSVSEAVLCVDGVCNDFQDTCLQCLQAVTQELDPSILGSSLHKVALDLEYICPGEARCKMLLGNSPIRFMDMAPPVAYLSVLYLSLIVQARSKAAGVESSSQEAYNYFDNLMFSYDSVEVLHAIGASLYVCIEASSLRIWIIIAQCLRNYINGAKDLVPLKIQPDSAGSLALSCFLIYPLVVCSSQKLMITQKHCDFLTSRVPLENCTLEQVTEVWMSLYALVNRTSVQQFPTKNTFAENLCLFLNGFLHQKSGLGESITKVNASCNSSTEHHFLSLCGNVAMCILENLHVEKVTPEAIKCGYTESSGINNCLEFIARLMNFIWAKIEDASMEVTILRLLPQLIHTVGCLQWKEDIISLTKVLCDPLLSWSTDSIPNTESINQQLQLLWTEIIRSLQRSWPAIEFDSCFLKLQAPLLEKTLGHPSPSISEPTIKFWNSAYGDHFRLVIPACLIHVLDKLSRLGKIKIKNKTAPTLQKGTLSLQAGDGAPRHKVTTTLSVCSKRVKLMESTKSCKSELPPYPKRKRSELTEHQKEVRRAQQGKTIDCSGHGPGVRTYTSADFSQGNEDSQDSQDIRDPELILNLLKRAG